MTHAYAETYLYDAMDSLGEAFDYAHECLGLELDEFFSLFCDTGYAYAFGQGSPRVIAGLSGTELAIAVLEKAGLGRDEYPPVQFGLGTSPTFWAGWILAFAQWREGFSFEEIRGLLSMAELESLYYPLHEASEDRATDSIAAILRRRTKGYSRLARQRRHVRLTQKQLGEASGVKVGTIRQYESGNKDINRAAGSTLLALSRALGCQMEDLLENTPPQKQKAQKGRPRKAESLT